MSQTVENGSLASYSLDAPSPTVIGNSTIPFHGPVHSWIYAPDRIALAHYAGHAVTVYDISDDTSFTQLQAFEFNQTYNKTSPRQDAAYPHSIIADPTGQFLVSPDLGADQLRLFKVLGSEDNYLLELIEPVNTTYGSGPRHGAFVQMPESGKTFYYILGEIGTSITGYEVTYPEGENGSTTIAFEQVYLDSVFQEGYGNSTGAPAELYAPEYNHLVLSVRNDNRSTYGGQGSDSLVSYEIDPETGDLTLLGLTPSGGSTPRGFSLNAEGTLLGVANQGTGNVLVYERDTETGIMADTPLATWTTEDLNNGNSLNYVLWWD